MFCLRQPQYRLTEWCIVEFVIGIGGTVATNSIKWEIQVRARGRLNHLILLN